MEDKNRKISYLWHVFWLKIGGKSARRRRPHCPNGLLLGEQMITDWGRAEWEKGEYRDGEGRGGDRPRRRRCLYCSHGGDERN